MRNFTRIMAGAASAVMLAIAAAAPAAAADTLRVAKVASGTMTFSVVDVGLAKGFFKAKDLDIEMIDFQGGAKAHQAMAAGALDILLGGGPDISFIARGSPEIAIAAITKAPSLSLIVPASSTVKTLDDLKGKKIGVSSPGSLSFWLAIELARVKGWGPNGVTPVSIGNQRAAELSAMQTGQVDAVIENISFGYQLEAKNEGRVVASCGEYVKDFIANAIFASTAIVKEKPDAVKRFMAGWLQSLAFMRDNKAETIAIVQKVTGYDAALQERDYEMTMKIFAMDGHFPRAAIESLSRSFIDLKILDTPPDMSKLYDENFLPKS